ncbi:MULTISPECIES: GAF and ANTAR domain-containing protein [unclassified Streptomyces]|uniref:GAF and ANTAR domain-containing protein n=1 Tax=unclassified Streptomyces TaxID=2593676 RepID=UPI0011CDDCAD|nr:MULTISPECIES: GAF and ANTAR domain-containing protein [unclassified Streptomyces]TXS69871.1 ANTAR domain-containing protein [Streptomyces sp. me109]
MDWREFAQEMASMARDLLAQPSVDATLERITASATELVAGCDAAGILLVRGVEVQTLAPTEQLVRHLDRLQQRVGHGPCFDAARMMGFLLFTDGEDFGTLNLYSRRPGAFTEVSEDAAVMLASHAAVALSSARTHAQMEQAVATRHQIGEAMGILMSSLHLTEEQAFAALRRHSQENNVKLREVARQVCEEGGVPGRCHRHGAEPDGTGL